MQQQELDALLMDLNYTRDTTSGQEGLELLAKIRALDSTLPVVVMTAWASVELAVEAMRRGARDFVEKPWDNARLLSVVRTQVELGRALRRGQRLEAENRALRGEGAPTLIAESKAMRPVLELIERVGPSDANVLVTGENGTGKGVVARVLHSVSARGERPMVTVNTGGISDPLFESELFGHVKGAFTDAKSDRVGRFELADGGTLFLDEIANIALGQQAKLLGVLETGEFERVGSSRTQRVDVRMLSATNSDLAAAVAEGRFRKDLLFRLKTVEIPLPPLRERREDIPLLARHFLAQHAQHYRKELSAFDDARAAGDARLPLARQRPRARPRRRTRRADEPRRHRGPRRPRPLSQRRGRRDHRPRPPRRAAPRRSRAACWSARPSPASTATSARPPTSSACRGARSTGGWTSTTCRIAASTKGLKRKGIPGSPGQECDPQVPTGWR